MQDRIIAILKIEAEAEVKEVLEMQDLAVPEELNDKITRGEKLSLHIEQIVRKLEEQFG